MATLPKIIPDERFLKKLQFDSYLVHIYQTFIFFQNKNFKQMAARLQNYFQTQALLNLLICY